MYVRVKTTPNSPRKSVQIVKSVRKGNAVSQKIVRYVGIALDDRELEQLKVLAESIKIKLEAEGQELLFSPEDLANKAISFRAAKKKAAEMAVVPQDLYTVNLKDLEEEDRVVSGIHDVYGNLFDTLGYGNVIKKPSRNKAAVKLLRDIVLARIANPKSKRGSVEMLAEEFGVRLNLDLVYRMMDKLDESAIDRLKDISYQNTATLYGGKIDVVFFDCTTLYFEAFEEDSLRKLGFSKDMKFNQVQVVLALMVTQDGLPIGYETHEGNAYEGHTLIPAIQKLRKRYAINRVIMVADSGMMNEENLKELENEKIDYIVGARLKNVPKTLQAEILNQERYTPTTEGNRIARFEHNGRELIVNYSAKRAKKDAHEREKTLEKLVKKLSKQKNPKDYLSNYGNKRFLKIIGESQFELDEKKIKEASAWDGLLGVTTNIKTLTAENIIEHYRGLWQVEEAFRITKHDLRIRPVFHWKPDRVRAHLAISFLSYSLVKHLVYRVKLQYIKLSPEEIRLCLLRVQTSILFDKKKKIRFGLPSKMPLHAKKIYALMRIPRTSTPFIFEKL